MKSHTWPSGPRAAATRNCGLLPDGSLTRFSSNHATGRIFAEFAPSRTGSGKSSSTNRAPTQPARLRWHSSRLIQELDAPLPYGWLHQLPAFHPANRACVSSHFHVVIALAHDVHAFTIIQSCQLLADLRDAAQERGGFFADKGFAQRFMLGPEHPRRQSHQGQQRHRNEESPLHVPLSNVALAARTEGALFATRAPPEMTPIFSTVVMIPCCSL